MERDGVFEIFVKFFTNFNSHAHVERDWKDFDFTLNKLNFNSHAHVERDNDKTSLKGVIGNFNSHAHVERDPI